MTTAALAPSPVGNDLRDRFQEAALRERVDGAPAWLAANRERAYRVFSELPFPTMFDEEWRRTDPEDFPFRKVEAAGLAGRMNTDVDPVDGFDLVIDVRSDGVAISERNGILDKGIRALPLQEAGEGVDACLNGAGLPAETGYFEALNGAFWNAGLLLDVDAGVQLDQGILVRCYAGAELFLPRMVIRLGEGASATVLEQRSSAPGAIAVTAREMYLAPGSRLKSVSVNDWDLSAYHIGNEMARVDRDAQVDLVSINLGSRMSKLKFGSEVAGPGAAAELDGLFFTHDRQHIDQTSLQVHASPDTYSRLLYKGAARDEGRSVYQGVIRANPGAIRVDAYQTNNNVLLNDGARVDTIPGLLIDADDLKCSHGATIGTLDEDQVFYLRTRGLNEEAARHLVLMGFFEEIVERVPYPVIQDTIHERLRQRAVAARG